MTYPIDNPIEFELDKSQIQQANSWKSNSHSTNPIRAMGSEKLYCQQMV